MATPSLPSCFNRVTLAASGIPFGAAAIVGGRIVGVKGGARAKPLRQVWIGQKLAAVLNGCSRVTSRGQAMPASRWNGTMRDQLWRFKWSSRSVSAS